MRAPYLFVVPALTMLLIGAWPGMAVAQEPPLLAPGTAVDPLLPTAQKRAYISYTISIADTTKSFRITATSKDGKPVRIFARFGQDMPEWNQADHKGDNVLYVDKSSSPPLKAGTWYIDVAYAGEAPAGNTCHMLLELDVEAPPAVELAVDGTLTADQTVLFSLPYKGRTYMTYVVDVADSVNELHVVATSEQDIDLYIRYGAQMNDYTKDADHYAAGQTPTDIKIRRDLARKPLQTGKYYIDVTFNQSAILRAASGNIVVHLNGAEALAVDATLQVRKPFAFSLPHPSGRVYQTFVVEVPAGSKSMRVVVVGDPGVDVFMRHGKQMENYETDAEFRVVGQTIRDIYLDAWHPTNPITPGKYFIDVTRNASAGSATVKAQVIIQLDENPPVDGQVVPGTSYDFELVSRGSGDSETTWVDVPAGVKKMTIKSTCAQDVDMAIRRGHWLWETGELGTREPHGNEVIVMTPVAGETTIAPGRYYIVVVYAARRGTAKGKLDVTLEK
ncbi:MAG: hypothetical protein AB7K09_06780 [Planctomycetota bacterium]